ncbi:MAG: glycosyl hydrolase family 18 protein [Dehalococcoidia bacterium]
MRQDPPRDPPDRPSRRETPRPERPFDRLLRRRPERDPAPIIIGGTIAFLAVVIVLVFVASSVLGGDDNGGGGGGTIDIAPGISGRLAQIPALPPGLQAVSQYIEFELANENSPAVIGLPLSETIDDASALGFYTFLSGRWQRQVDASLVSGGRVAEGDFPSVPDNLAVLRVVSQAYVAAGSIPSGSTVHPEAQLNILSPRDFSPAGDGSVQGSATSLDLPATIEVMPTIVGSGTDAAAVVDSILANDDLRSAHVEAVVSLVRSGSYAGVDLEYASVDAKLEAQFTEFVQSLADALHAEGAKLSLTLPPPTGQGQAYDWAELGQAADLIRILPIANPVTYWEAMPEAMNRLVEDVDPAKVLLVLSPFSVEAVGDVVRPLGYLQAMVVAGEAAVREPENPNEIEPGSTVKLVATNLDQAEGASTLSWVDEAAAVSFAPGGTESRRIYIENAFSFGFKLELVQAYGLAGVSVSDASAESDVPDIWPVVNGLIESATVTLARPNESTLLPIWQAPSGGDLGAGAGTTATWIPSEAGLFDIVLVVSDGVRRFGRETSVSVNEPDAPDTTATPIVTFAPEETPTPTPGEETPTPTPATGVFVEVGLLADGDDEDGSGDPKFSNDELTSPGSFVTYLVTFDNDSDVEVTIASYSDNTYADIVCNDVTTGEDVLGLALGPDDGDGPGLIDGGSDEIQCTYTVTAPELAGEVVQNTITGSVQAESGDIDADQDNAKVTTIDPSTPTPTP